MKKVSFTKTVKDEIISSDLGSVEKKKAFLSATVKINASIIFRNKQSVLYFDFTNAKAAKHLYSLLIEVYNCDAHLSYLNKNKTRHYIIEIDDNADDIIEDLGVSFLEGKISKEIVYDDETISGYLAGAFLASGSINSPETSNYHLEISVVDESYAKWLSKLFFKYKKIEMNPKITVRRDKYVIYFKKSDQISNFLIVIGATNCCMEFENQRAYRDFSNNTNRLMNLDTANMNKTLEISLKQIEEIRFIDDVLGIHNFHNPKKEMLCYLRLDNESASMSELANMLSKEFGYVITKSNVNHLFRDLHELYMKLKGIKV